MHRPRLLIFASVVAAAVISLLAAGCGAGSSTTPGTTPTANGALLAYSRCMHSHGVPNFPDPTSSGGIPKAEVVAQDPSSPQFQTAQTACQRLQPTGGLGRPQTAQQTRAHVADELSFARCVRNRGVIRFPDPNAQGELSVEMVQAQGIDLHSPAVLQDVEACLPASHGALTPAKVRAALHDASG